MTARQKEIATVSYAIKMCEELIAKEEQDYEQAIADLEHGIDCSPAFYRESINETRGWLKDEQKRLSVLMEQEVNQ